jgi:hypothetical protein
LSILSIKPIKKVILGWLLNFYLYRKLSKIMPEIIIIDKKNCNWTIITSGSFLMTSAGANAGIWGPWCVPTNSGESVDLLKSGAADACSPAFLGLGTGLGVAVGVGGVELAWLLVLDLLRSFNRFAILLELWVFFSTSIMGCFSDWIFLAQQALGGGGGATISASVIAVWRIFSMTTPGWALEDMSGVLPMYDTGGFFVTGWGPFLSETAISLRRRSFTDIWVVEADDTLVETDDFLEVATADGQTFLKDCRDLDGPVWLASSGDFTDIWVVEADDDTEDFLEVANAVGQDCRDLDGPIWLVSSGDCRVLDTAGTKIMGDDWIVEIAVAWTLPRVGNTGIFIRFFFLKSIQYSNIFDWIFE